MGVVTLPMSAISISLQLQSDFTFSCLVWHQFAHSLHEVWRASPATIHRQTRLWHEGYPHKRSSDLGWGGSCPSFGRSQTKLYKNKGFSYTPCYPEFLCRDSTRIKLKLLDHCSKMAQNERCEYQALHYGPCYLFCLQVWVSTLLTF